MEELLTKTIHLANHWTISKKDLGLHLQSHPNYPYVKAITDTLDYFGIENLAAQVPKEQIEHLPNFFLALVAVEKKQDYVLVRRRKNKVQLEYRGNEKELLTNKEFGEKWTGTFIAIDSAKKDEILRMPLNFNMSSLIILATLSTAVLFTSGFNYLSLSTTTLSILGLFLSYLIAKEELGIHNFAVANVCNVIGLGNCTATIRSNQSKVLGFFSLVDAVVIFFVSMTILGVLSLADHAANLILITATTPFIIYSLYIQGFILKKWCVLCVGTILIVIAQLAMHLILAPAVLSFNLNIFLKSGLVFLIVATLWLFIKSLINDRIQLEQTQKDFLWLKRNEKVVQALLRQKKVKSSSEIEINTISYGAIEGTSTITFIINPFCGHCVEAYYIFRNLLKTSGNKLRLSLLFNIFVQDKENKAYQVAHKVTELFQNAKTDLALKALDDWFVQRDVVTWQQQYGIPTAEENRTDHILLAQKDWCKENKITYTPAILINEYVFPREFNKTELPLLLEQLINAAKEELEPII